MADLKAVFFDVSGTLWDANACALHLLEIVVSKFSPPLPREDPAHVIRRFNAAFLNQPTRRHVRESRPSSRLKRFEGLLEGYGLTRHGLAQDMSRTYDSARRLCMRRFLRPDAHPVLGELRRNGLQCGVILNGSPAVQRHMLECLGLETRLDHVVLGQVEGYAKPDVRLFRRALDAAGTAPDQMLYVGDSPLTDVFGAVRAGIRTAWYQTGLRRLPQGFPPPDFTIRSLSEVLDIVA